MCGLNPSLLLRLVIYVLQINTRRIAEAELWDPNLNLAQANSPLERDQQETKENV